MVQSSLYYRNYNNFLISRSGIEISPFSSVTASVKALSAFKSLDEVKLPLLISGRLVTSGEYKDNRYGTVTLPPESLKPTVDEWVGVFIYKSHAIFEKIMKGEDVSVDEVAGKITKASWNEKENAIDFYAEISDQMVAFKMANDLIKYVSVGFARDVMKKDGKFYFVNIEPKEVSLVFDPRDQNAYFTVHT